MPVDGDRTVRIFYSSSAQPSFPDQIAAGLRFCREHDITVELIDITEQPERAREADIVTTPTVIIAADGEIKRYPGFIQGLQDVVSEQLLG